MNVALGGLVVTCLPLDSRFAGSNPAEDDGISKGDKNPLHYFLRRSKAVGPMSYIKGMLKKPTSMKEILGRKKIRIHSPRSSCFIIKLLLVELITRELWKTNLFYPVDIISPRLSTLIGLYPEIEQHAYCSSET
jgi:hypothetical protein